MDMESNGHTGTNGRDALLRRGFPWLASLKNPVAPPQTAMAVVERRMPAKTEAPTTHPSIRQLFEYWNERRGNRLAPEREDIDPDPIRHVLADAFILSFDPSRRHPFRIAGTRVCALFRRELKGEGFVDLWSETNGTDIRTLLAFVVDQSVGVLADVAAMGMTGTTVNLELLMLPLNHHGRANARLLGALVPSGPPLWLGAHSLSDLNVVTHRYLGPAAAMKLRPRAVIMSGGGRRHEFVLYDGGRT